MPRPRESEKEKCRCPKQKPQAKKQSYSSRTLLYFGRFWRTSKRDNITGGALEFDFVQSNREFKLHVYGKRQPIQVENFLIL